MALLVKRRKVDIKEMKFLRRAIVVYLFGEVPLLGANFRDDAALGNFLEHHIAPRQNPAVLQVLGQKIWDGLKEIRRQKTVKRLDDFMPLAPKFLELPRLLWS
jgi:hypothetical protein